MNVCIMAGEGMIARMVRTPASYVLMVSNETKTAES